MEFFASFLDFFVHLDHHMNTIIQDYGALSYLILFAIIFFETGLVVTPFLPGDSLLFVVGALAAGGTLHAGWLIVILSAAAILGDTANYWIGTLLAPKIISQQKIRFIKREHIERTHAFFSKYGGKTIIMARFIPIVRTFAPFLAGVGTMSYPRFLTYNVTGGILWVCVGVFCGYFFGNLPFVKKNFTLVILMIIFISLIPAVVEYFKAGRPVRPT